MKDKHKCIYCMENKEKGFFNREHVLPVAFGSFRNNLVLHDTVCADCNSYFSKNLELTLARDSVEGIQRFFCGVKEPRDYKPHKHTRLLIRVAGEGVWRGALACPQYDAEKDALVIEAIPQIALQKKEGGDWIYLEIDSIKARNDLEKKGFITRGKNAVRIVYLEKSFPLEKCILLLNAKGFDLKLEEASPQTFPYGEQVRTNTSMIIDKTIARAYAKIAFNYLSYVKGKTFVMDKAFDEIRKFIRCGAEIDKRRVKPSKALGRGSMNGC